MLDLKTVHLDGPRLEPASGSGADSLIILLHGHGSNGADMIELARAWQAAVSEGGLCGPGRAPGHGRWRAPMVSCHERIAG